MTTMSVKSRDTTPFSVLQAPEGQRNPDASFNLDVNYEHANW